MITISTVKTDRPKGLFDSGLGINVTDHEFIDYIVGWSNEAVQPRSCPFDFIDSCEPDIDDMHSVSACQSYFAPVLISEKFFRNPHCALCNGVSEELFSEYCTSCSLDALAPPGLLLTRSTGRTMFSKILSWRFRFLDRESFVRFQ